MNALADLLLSLVLLTYGVWLMQAGWSKQHRYWLRWHQALAHYRLLPATLRPMLARTIPSAEVGLGLALCLPWTDRIALPAVAGLMLLFAVALAGNLALGVTRFDCGCTPGDRRPHAGWLLVRALLLAALAGGLSQFPEPAIGPRLLAALALAVVILPLAGWANLQRHSSPSRAL